MDAMHMDETEAGQNQQEDADKKDMDQLRMLFKTKYASPKSDFTSGTHVANKTDLRDDARNGI